MLDPRKIRPGAGIRARFGIVLDMFDSKYQGEMVRQLRLAAEQRFTDVVVFPGGWLATTMRGGALRRRAFDLVSAASVDGVILLSACLSRDVGITGVAEFCERFNGLPVCAIGEPLAKCASLGVDNAEGMRAVLKHLIVDHGYRRIACIRGPLNNTDAEARHQSLCAELVAHGLQLDPSLLRVGDFITESGRAAMTELLTEPGLPLEAVVAANDYMALGALEVLSLRQASLPNPVAVVGFDNIDEANFSSPPLTTVEQPFAELAAGAIRSLHAQLQGERAPTHVTLSTALVVRRSCGCSGEMTGRARAGLKLETTMNFDQQFKLQQEGLQAELSRASRGFFCGVKRACEGG